MAAGGTDHGEIAQPSAPCPPLPPRCRSLEAMSPPQSPLHVQSPQGPGGSPRGSPNQRAGFGNSTELLGTRSFATIPRDDPVVMAMR